MEVQGNKKDQMKLKFRYMWLISALLLASCADQPYYQKSYSFQGNQWNQDVKPTFKIEVSDTTKAYDFMLTLRTTTDYGFSNVWIYLNTKTPNGERGREPFELKIANEDGSWAGKKTGTVVENQLIFSRRKLPQKGTYYFTLEQGVTQKNLPEVLDIGLQVDEAEEK